MAYIRKSAKGNGRTEVQVCYKSRGKVYKTIQVGTAQDERELNALIAEGRRIIGGVNRTLFSLEEYENNGIKNKS